MMERVDVVVIDDDEGILWFLQEMLTLYDISFKVANNGAEGLKLLEEYRPQVAVIDVKLGSMTGLEVARRLKSLALDTRILFMTGYSNVIPSEVMKELPVLAVLEKPFEVESFMKVITEALK
jgi:DNA-binding NtrC family response regulator